MWLYSYIISHIIKIGIDLGKNKILLNKLKIRMNETKLSILKSAPYTF